MRPTQRQMREHEVEAALREHDLGDCEAGACCVLAAEVRALREELERREREEQEDAQMRAAAYQQQAATIARVEDIMRKCRSAAAEADLVDNALMVAHMLFFASELEQALRGEL